MRLITRIVIRLSYVMLIVMSLWTVVFYYILMDEINDETDDALEDYSELIIMRVLAGQDLPSKDSGTNNTYYLQHVSKEYARSTPHIVYSDEEVYIVEKGENEPARVLRTIFKDSHGDYYELTVLIPSYEKDDLRETIVFWLVALYVLLFLVVVIISYLVIRRSFRPLYVMLDWLNDYKLNDGIKPIENPTKTKEFRQLNDALMRSVEKNQEAYERQKMFIGNASHELQTPLAICRNRLELLADNESLGEKELDEISKINKTLEQAIKLNKMLLLISRIENGQYPADSEIDVNALVKDIADDYRQIYGYMNVDLTIMDNKPMSVMMNASLARTLFGNMLKNAYAHNIPEGHIRVKIYADKIVFSNSGPDAPLDGRRIFERFYQGAKKEGSTGLGLALADTICKLSSLYIYYDFADGEHRFTIRKLATLGVSAQGF